MRLRDLGLRIGQLPTGPWNAITDVRGVRVGHTTLVRGDGPLEVRVGPVRTGVSVVVPSEDIGERPLFAGCHRLNGCGELTGLEWVRESGTLTTPIALTNTRSVGVVRDAVTSAPGGAHWSLPVVGETWDGVLNDIRGMHVRAEHVHQALAAASSGPVVEGNVGAGTGTICHDFKGGMGTASRVVGPADGGWTVGALVQANYGDRERLAVDGVPVGLEIGTAEVPAPEPPSAPTTAAVGTGSIIVILATDAPLLPHQCEPLAQRAGLGLARAGGQGEHWSGDLFLAFSTGNAGRLGGYEEPPLGPVEVSMLSDDTLSALFWAAIEATEEAIANALVAAETMVGRDGITAHALPHDRLVQVMARHGRGPAS